MANKDINIQDCILSSLKELGIDDIKEDITLENKEHLPLCDEGVFLENVRERILVLFEGLQSCDDENINTKLDITLNFLEYLLAKIEQRLEKVK